jgi:hypothetical protein
MRPPAERSDIFKGRDLTTAAAAAHSSTSKAERIRK